ncbi:WhiB family transcriptional regulator [Streptomyces virginiae]
MSTLVTNPGSRPHAATARRGSWYDLAACRNRPAEFAADEAAAKGICAGCPVTAECLAAALQEEGTAAPAYRADIRGGLDPHERAARAGYQRVKDAPAGIIAGDLEEAERLVLERTLSDQQIAEITGMGREAVGKTRRNLGLGPLVDLSAATPEQRLAQRTRPTPDGHLLWVGSPNTVVSGCRIKNSRLAFQVGHGRPPEGIVKRTCDVKGCVAWDHLTDSILRSATALAGTQQ